ncbi:P-loop NTPase fold protein [Ruegeria conchae]|uniref:KAP family P-loop NTPase fold protein n=1 Tax=Ruegeria conchae TaxID=981384 RepID=UPI0029C7590D|nr:P-loop NTPase fold protein [Ruegeria conchae]
MRLTIPEPKIDLYTDGFAKHDKLSRKSTGDKLSELVERIDDPLVIALDGAWGSGKSFFLKCWVGEHLKRDETTTQTVYFDAFKHDFLDDPLIALTGAIAERFEDAKDTVAQNAWSKAKRVAPALGRTLVRTGISVATAGLVTKADELGDAAINTVSSEVDGAVAEFWKIENKKRAAMEGFRQALVDLTEPDEDRVPTRKLVVVIDELDRCRPDYALSLLEIIKHFFNVDGVHFVLGVNLKELQNSVCARYGSNIEAFKYLQKFVSVVAPINGPKPRNTNFASYLKYFDFVASETGLTQSWKGEWLEEYLKLVDHHVHFSLRDIERLVTLASVSPTPDMEYPAAPHIFLGLCVLKVATPDMFSKVRSQTLTFDEVTQVFNIRDRGQQSPFKQEAHFVWRLALGLKKLKSRRGQIKQNPNSSRKRIRHR